MNDDSESHGIHPLRIKQLYEVWTTDGKDHHAIALGEDGVVYRFNSARGGWIAWPMNIVTEARESD